MKKTQIIIKDTPLKNFLSLFDPKMPIGVIEFGDTCHPSDGYVDAAVLNNPKTVQDLISLDYDYNGLVIFIATIGDFHVIYHSEKFEIEAEPKLIQQLLITIKNLNTQKDSKSKFEVIED